MGRALLLFVLLPVTLFAQDARVTRYTAPLAGTVVLSEMDDKYEAYVYSIEAPVPDGDVEKIRLRKAKEESALLFPRVAQRAVSKRTATLQPPIVTEGYEVDTTSGIPPDNDMAMSKGGIGVSVINSFITMVDANNNGQRILRRSLGFISSAVNLADPINDNRYDPKVQYDPEADRYICVILNGRDQYNYVLVGFSLSNDPTEGWAFYKFYGDYKNDATWFDYPGVVMTKDELFITGNKIKYAAPWETGFTESVIYQISKKSGYDSAATLTYQIWDGIKYNGKSLRNLFPVRPGRGMQGPEQYFLSNRNFDTQNDSIFLVKVPDDLASNNRNLTIELLKSPVKYGVPPNGRQKDTFVLNTNDGRVLGAYAMNGEIQFVSTTVVPATGASGVYHGKIRNYDSTPELYYADIYSEPNLDLGYPNISYVGDSVGENYSIISFDYTGPDTYAGIGAIFHTGNEYSDMVRVKEGNGTVQMLLGKNQRWGDYTGTQVDFNDTSSVWISGLFGRQSNRYNYGTWMAKLKSPKATVYPEPEDSTLVNNINKFYPNPVVEMVNYAFSMPEDGTVKFRIYGMDGKVVAEILNQSVTKGNNVIQFNIGHLSRGIYFLKGIRSNGEMIIEQKFQKL